MYVRKGEEKLLKLKLSIVIYVISQLVALPPTLHDSVNHFYGVYKGTRGAGHKVIDTKNMLAIFTYLCDHNNI